MDLNICAPSDDEHVHCRDWRHGFSLHFSRHLKFHDDLRKQNSAHKNQNIQDHETGEGNRERWVTENAGTHLSRIGIPNFDILVKGCCDKQPSIHRIPNGRRDGEPVAILVLLVHKQYVPVLRYEPGFVFRRVPHIEHSGRPIRCPGEEVPPLCQINLTIWSDYKHQQTRLTHCITRTP